MYYTVEAYTKDAQGKVLNWVLNGDEEFVTKQDAKIFKNPPRLADYASQEIANTFSAHLMVNFCVFKLQQDSEEETFYTLVEAMDFEVQQ